MATRFDISFPTIRNAEFRVYIDDADYVGASTEVDAASDGFTVDYDGNNSDMLDPIKGSRATFTIAVTDDTLSELESFAADLLSSAEGRFTMRIDHNTGFASDTLWWCGYVLADLSGFEDRHPPYGFRVVATDGLSRLKGIEYNDGAAPAEPIGNVSFLDHINNCLTSDGLAGLYFTGSDIFIRTVVNWVDNTIGTPTAAKCPLKYSRGAGSVFAKRENNDGTEEWKFDSCYDVLEKILRDWQARIYFSGGCYRVEQIAERSLDTFFERRFDKTGTYLSSTTVVNYDKPVNQTLTESRLSGGVFNHLPAVKEVEVVYEHRTASNQLTGTGGKWNIDSPAGDTVTISNVTTDGDTIFRIQGRIYVKGALDLSYTAPWRYVFNLKVAKGSKYLTSVTASQQSNGTYLPVVVRTAYTWENSLGYYEISSEFTFAATIDQYIPFAFDVEDMPTGGGSIDIQFTVEDARRVDGGPVAVTLTDWRVLNPAFIIINSSDVNSLIEVDREYTATNPDTGNSLVLEAKNSFGYAVRGWTETKIQTTADLSSWNDSGVFWDHGTGTTNGQFGELWAREAIALMRTPTGTYSGSFHSQNIFPHHRILLPDNTAYLFMRMSFESRELTYRGEWMRAGVNRTGVTTGPTRKLGNLWAIDPSSTPSYPTGGNPGGGNGGIQASGDIAFAALAANYVGTTIAAGTITSIPLELPVAENAFLDGDDILVFNPTRRSVFTFTVATTSSNGDTALAVDSTVITEDIPAGCYVLYSFLNRATTTGGGGPSLPPGTDTQTLRYSGTDLEANSALRNNGTNISINTAPDALHLLKIKQVGDSDGLAIERDTDTRQLRIYQDSSAYIDTTASNLFIRASGGQILLYGPGGGSFVNQIDIAALSSVTSNFGNSALLRLSATYAPTAAGGDFGFLKFLPTINQTGAADQNIYFMDFVPTLTAVTGILHGVRYWPDSGRFLWQPNGAAVVSHFRGVVGIGSGTTSPAQTLHVDGTARITGSDGTATTIVGRDGDGDISAITVSTGLNLSGNVLTATAGAGVTSVALDMPTAVFDVSGSPITGSGTFTVTLDTQAANTIFSGPSTGIPAVPTFRGLVISDLPAGYDTNQTVTLSGDVTGSGTTAITTTIANNAVTTVKILDANVTAAKLANTTVTPGTYTNTDLTVDAQGRITAASNGSAGSGVTGSGSANHIAYWTTSSNISFDNGNLYWDATDNEMGIRTSTPGAVLHIAAVNSSTVPGLLIEGSVTTNVNNTIRNTNTTSTANAFLNINTASTAAGDPAYQLSVTGGATWSLGIDNSDADKLKVKNATHPSATPNNSGITIATGTTAKVGINTDSPAYDLDVANSTRSRTFFNLSNGTDNKPTISNNTGMGTGPTGLFSVGSQNCLYYTFTTGTSPASNAVVFTVTPLVPFPNFMVPVIGAHSASASGAFRIGSAGNTSFDVYSIGGLTASTTYALGIIWGGW